MISIDLPARKLVVDVSDEELAARKKAWQRPAPKYTRGWLSRYSKQVLNAAKGAVLKD